MNEDKAQELFKSIGTADSKQVAVIGIGALGTVASELLIRAGTESLILVDRDYVEQDNLGRQALYTQQDIGTLKVHAARKRLHGINRNAKIEVHAIDLDNKNIEMLRKPGLVLGCTDNLESRFLINDYCKKHNIPWIYGGAIGTKGMVFASIPKGACISCFLKPASLGTCETEGIQTSAASTCAGIMVSVAFKILSGEKPAQEIIRFDLKDNTIEKIKVNRSKVCDTCNSHYRYLAGEVKSMPVSLCGKGAFRFKDDFDFKTVLSRLKKMGKVKTYNGVLHYKEITVFEHGMVLVKARTKEKAEELFSRYIR